MNAPFFSIIIPAKGRPHYLDNAISSVLSQDFKNFEVLISNNGADPALLQIAEKYFQDDRVKYIEFENVLSMPSHWEKITLDFNGRYLLILTDRSVLKADALSHLHNHITQQSNPSDVICWPWEIYYDDLKILIPTSAEKKAFEILKPDSELLKIAQGESPLQFKLPRGLNSCVSKQFITILRKQYKTVFRKISPDITFAYLSLLNVDQYTFINRPLFISQGLQISNGGNTLSGDASGYFKFPDLNQPFTHVPIKSFLFYTSLTEDFLSTVKLCSRDDLIKKWNKEKYYTDCLDEIDIKKSEKLIKLTTINDLEASIFNALYEEDPDLIEKVLKKKKQKNVIKKLISRKVKKLFSRYPALFKVYLKLKHPACKSYEDVMWAAGYK